MHVGLIIYSDLDTLSGGYLYDRMLVEHLRANGDTVTVISLPWRSYAHRLGDNLSGRLLGRLKGASFDLLLQDELNHPSLFILNSALKKAVPYPLISIVHHLRISEAYPVPLMSLYRALERRYLNSVDGFIFNSTTTKGVVESLLDQPRPSVIAYPAGSRFPGGDSARIAARAQEAGPLRLLFVGNLIPRKRLDVALHALAALPERVAALTVVGDAGPDPAHAAALTRLAARLGIAGRVTFRGRLSDPALRDEFEQSHLLVVPSDYEGFGIVYLEGMAAGLPAIATSGGAAHEVISDGVNGFLIPPGDRVKLALLIQDLADDRDRLAEMSRAALDRFRSHPAWETSMDQARQFLLSLTG